MKSVQVSLGILLILAFAGGVWILVRHQEWVKGAPEEDEDAGEVMAEVPVRLGKVARATLHRYVDGYGTVEAEPAQGGKPAASSRVASPVPGVVAEVFCAQGQTVQKGALLFQLDDRAAKSEEDRAQAALLSARASLDRLKAFPRPDQINVAEMQADRAKQGVEFSRRKTERLAKLSADQLASEKTLQEAELELISARSDLAIAEKQLAILKSTPTPEEVAEAQGKVAEAEKGVAAAKVQRSLLRIEAPLSGTVIRVKTNPGEAVDPAAGLAEIADLGRLVVEGSVPAPELRSLARGMEVELGAGIRGKVVQVGFDVERKSDSGGIRISVPPNSGLTLGQAVHFRVVAEERKNCLVVPRACVVRNSEGKTVIVGFLGEKAIQKEVQAGLREGDLVEIQGEEIDEGDPVVTEGAYGLPGEAKIRDLGTKK